MSDKNIGYEEAVDTVNGLFGELDELTDVFSRMILDDTRTASLHNKTDLLENSSIAIPAFFCSSLAMLSMSINQLARLGDIQGVATLSRSAIDCMANIMWIHDSANNEIEFREKTSKIAQLGIDMQVRMEGIDSGDAKRFGSIPELGAGPVINRLDRLGSGWRHMYSYLSAYTHMDTSYYSYVLLGRQDAATLFCIEFACTTLIKSAKMLSELVSLDAATADELSDKMLAMEKSHESLIEKAEKYAASISD